MTSSESIHTIRAPIRDEDRPSSNTGRRILTHVILLLLAGALVYSNSLNGPFIFDDEKNILDRPLVRSLDSLGPLLRSTKRPALMLTLSLNYAVAGEDVRPYHLVNLAGHLAAALVLLGIVRYTCLLAPSGDSLRRHADWIAFSVALLWTVHPLQTQSVTYIIQRSESMMGLFYLLSLYCLLRGSRSRRPVPWLLSGVLSFAVSLGFKGAAISAPLVLLCYDRIFLSDTWRTLFRRRGWFHAAVLVVACAFVLRMSNIFTAAVKTGVGNGCGISAWQYLRTQPGVIMRYLKLSVWPRDLCLDWGQPIARDAWEIYAPGSCVLLLLALAFWASYRFPRAGFLAVTFFLLLAPTSSFVPIIDPAFEHRMYLPLACLSALAVAGALALVSRFIADEANRRRLVLAVVIASAAALGLRSHARNDDYRSSVSIWTDVTRHAPRNARGWYNLGLAQGGAGDRKSAVASYLRAVALDPSHARAHYNLALILAQQERFDRAIDHYRRALEAKPDYADASYNLARLHARLGRTRDSIEQYRHTLAIDPGYRDASYNLAGLYTKVKRHDAAIEQYHRTLEIDPKDFGARLNLASLLYRLGRVEDAVRQYRRILVAEPAHHRARLLLATVLSDAGRTEEAEQCYEDEIRRRPRDAELPHQYGVYLARRGDFRRAADWFRRCLSLEPDHTVCAAHLGMALYELGASDEAARWLRSALRRRPDLVRAGTLLARILARSDNAEIHDGRESLQLEQPSRAGRETVKTRDDTRRPSRDRTASD